jgi:hypothetical protein
MPAASRAFFLIAMSNARFPVRQACDGQRQRWFVMHQNARHTLVTGFKL